MSLLFNNLTIFVVITGFIAIPMGRAFLLGFTSVLSSAEVQLAPWRQFRVKVLEKLQGWMILWVVLLPIAYGLNLTKLDGSNARLPAQLLLSLYLPLIFLNTWLLVLAGCIFWTPIVSNWFFLSLLATGGAMLGLIGLNLAQNAILPYQWIHYTVQTAGGYRIPLELWAFYNLVPCLLLVGSLLSRAILKGRDWFHWK